MQLCTYLSFNGNCRAAFEFYAALLGGKIVVMTTFGETPACDQVSPQARDLIMHARLEIGDQALMATDATPQYPYHGVTGAHVVIDVNSPAEAERLFTALSINGKVEMPMQPTFWAQRYGIAIDRFGIPWMVNCALAV